MKFTQAAKNIIKKLDQYSPYPLLYQFRMSNDEKDLFDRTIRKSRNFLEFGLGGSTIRSIQKSKATIYSVESSSEWIAYMRQYFLLRHLENRRVFIFLVDIGPTGRFGYPVSENVQNQFHAYSSNIFKSIDAKTLDLVLVDGRFRVACILKTILECRDNNDLKILIHDFWNRKRYHMVLKYLDVLDKVDTLGLFSVNKNIRLKSVREDYEAYKANPD